MSLIRPEATEWILRWREAIIGLALAGLGVYGVTATFGVLFYLSYLLIAAGAALIWEGIQRARLPVQGGGPGLVEVDERQVTYFGPGGGAAVSLDILTRVEIETTDAGPFASDVFWCLQSEGAPALRIPTDAAGAEALYDALTALPGVDFGKVIAAMGSTEPNRFVIWTRTKADRRLT